MKITIAIMTLYVIIVISILHAREMQEQRKERLISRATGGYNEQ